MISCSSSSSSPAGGGIKDAKETYPLICEQCAAALTGSKVACDDDGDGGWGRVEAGRTGGGVTGKVSSKVGDVEVWGIIFRGMELLRVSLVDNRELRDSRFEGDAVEKYRSRSTSSDPVLIDEGGDG